MVPDDKTPLDAAGKARKYEMDNTQVLKNNPTQNAETPDPHVEDALKYFREVLPKYSTYNIWINRFKNDDSIEIKDADSLAPTRVTASRESISELVDYTRNNKESLEKEYGVKIGHWDHDDDSDVVVTLRKNTRKHSGEIIDNGVSREVYDFIETAYQAGVNIVISGRSETAMGSFLNILMDSSKDYTPTVLISSNSDMVFGSDHREIAQIIGADGGLVQHGMTMNTPRVVLDEMYSAVEDFENMAMSAKQGKQYIMVANSSPTELARLNEKAKDYIFESKARHPFELRVDIGYKKLNGKKVITVIAVHELIFDKGETFMRTLFSGNYSVADPTRSIRRKLEGKTRRQKEFGVKNIRNANASEMPALIAVSEKEKEELLIHRDALSAFLHATGDHEALKHFNAMDKFLNQLK